MQQVSKERLLGSLEGALRDLFEEHRRGASAAKLARAHGYLDGYMRALLETGTTTRVEMLRLVAAQRTLVDGPALGQVTAELASSTNPLSTNPMAAPASLAKAAA